MAGLSLTRLQRILLGTDGTLTPILEVYAEERVAAVKLRQVLDVSGEPDARLELADGASVLRREVLLRGQRTGRTLLHASADVAVERAPAHLLDGLEQTDEPIGRLLTAGRTESFREILEVGREAAGRHAGHFGIPATADVLVRTYRIVHAGAPLVVITERFPSRLFVGPAPRCDARTHTERPVSDPLACG